MIGEIQKNNITFFLKEMNHSLYHQRLYLNYKIIFIEQSNSNGINSKKNTKAFIHLPPSNRWFSSILHFTPSLRNTSSQLNL